MAETRNVGSASASIAANTTALMNAIVNLTSPPTTVVLAPNSHYAATWWRSNVSGPLTIISADRNNPAIMTEGFSFTGQEHEGFMGNRNGPFASSVSNVTIDGIHFVPRKLTVVSPRQGGGGNYTIQDAPGGLSWRIDPTFAGFGGQPLSKPELGGYGAQDAYMSAIVGMGGTNNIVVQNCFFDGYGRAITCEGSNNFTFRHNTWTRWSEDIFYIAGATNTIIEYNFFDHGRAVSTRDAFFGWSYGQSATQAPPHTDVCQPFRPMTGFRFQYNHIVDTDRSHGILLITNASGGSHNAPIIHNNYMSLYDATGIWVGASNNARVTSNKVVKGGGSEQPMIYVNPDTANNATITNNIGNRLRPTSLNGNNGNVETNGAQLPSNWTEIRQGMTGNNRFAGQYGGVGGLPQTAPSFSTTPQLNPRPQVEAGDTLTATQAVVSGNPTPTLSHRWFRNGVLMAAQTDLTYPTVDPGDINDVFTYQTRAANGVGPAFVDSNLSLSSTCITPIVGAGAPVATTDPELNPEDVVAGDTITATRAQFTGTAPITYAHRWFRNSVLQAGQTALTYVTLSTDAGAVITYRTRASNSVQSNVDSNLSNAITVLAAGPPAGLTAGQVAFEALVQDSDFPDARRTFTIRIPSTSPAFNADAMSWTDNLVAPDIRPMRQLSNQAGDNIWQADSAGPTQTGHLRSPNGSFNNVLIYYRLTPTSIRSDPSTYTFSVTVPDEGNPDPVLVDTVFLDETRRVAPSALGDAYRLVTLAEGIIWRSPVE